MHTVYKMAREQIRYCFSKTLVKRLHIRILGSEFSLTTPTGIATYLSKTSLYDSENDCNLHRLNLTSV